MTGRDHGGGLDAARAVHGGARADWLDLSTGINPEPYPLPPLPPDAWTALPDAGATDALARAARAVWRVPDGAEVLAAPGASALIARMPLLAPAGPVHIPGPTYNEHAAAFGSRAADALPAAGTAFAVVNPNNPDGRWWTAADLPGDAPLSVIDESFSDIDPARSLIELAARRGTVVLKSFGKFWGLPGLRLGFAIGRAETLVPLRSALGPWPVSGPALAIGASALADIAWAEATRTRLARDAARLDALMAPHGRAAGGTPLFRLYETANAEALRDRLARHRIWSRTFPYSRTWLRLGLPPARGWARVEAALA